MRDDEKSILVLIVIVGIVLILGSGGCLVVKPHYQVWSSEMDGKAKLAEATSSRMIQIEEAKGRFEASKMLAASEIERAKGVAEANKIIGDSLKGNEAYLRYLWVQGLQDNKDGDREKLVIYVPTEANMPMMEAGRAVEAATKPTDKK